MNKALDKIEQLEAENNALKEELKNWKIAHASQVEANQKLKDDELLAVKSIHKIKEKISAINDDLCDCSSFLL